MGLNGGQNSGCSCKTPVEARPSAKTMLILTASHVNFDSYLADMDNEIAPDL